MRVEMPKLFETFLEAQASKPDAALVYSLATPARLGEYLADLDPEMSLDWSDESFQGLPSLREKVIARMGYGPECGAADVLITAGANEANFLAMTQLVQTGDEVVVDVPGWPQALVLARALGAVVKPLCRREEDDWRFDCDELDRLVTDRTRLVFLCNPNNPTGQVLASEEMARVVAIARRVGAHVLCDEVYRGLEWSGRETPRVASLYERGISTGSVSKLLGMQGLRTGWLVCRDRALVRAAMVLREHTSEIMNVMGERIADLALDAGRYASSVARVRAAEEPRLDRLDRFIAETPGLSWRRPQAGLIGLCHLALPVDGDTFARRLLEAPYRTLVMSGSAYGCSHHVRIGVGGGPGIALELGLQRIAALVNSLVTAGAPVPARLQSVPRGA